ncbi:DUF4129 domain-containing protein [Catenulispora rubra]|uniref:DUF4129 domain-containing protein n=1 Tax=Catenulispora rubra TaxID=280293 RepID=UPI0018921321|nr:DUF4129 domain-containing protein [Catenulispora rubra]
MSDSPGKPSDPGKPSNSGKPTRWLPAAVVVLAVAAMAVASRHDGPLDPGAGSGLWEGARPAIALGAVVLLVVVATNFAKHRDDGYGVLHRAGTATAVLLAAAAVLTPIGLVFLGRKPQPSPPDPVTPNTVPSGTRTPKIDPGVTLKPAAGKPGAPIAAWIVQTVMVLIVAAAVALVVYVLIQLLSRRRLRMPVATIDFEPLNPELEQLAEAVAAGTEALEYEGDAREAVIACYSAMELAVSAGGALRRATDTPEEFLRRVTAAQLIPEEPARQLTDLFREARFSHHPIAESQRDAAREALRAISEHLRVRAEALEAAKAQAKATAAAAAASASSQTSASASASASAQTAGRR